MTISNKLKSLCLCAMLSTALIAPLNSVAQQKYTPTEDNIKAREDFRDRGFGIFLHWGIYSIPAQGEWYMNSRDINYKEYEKLAKAFYPSYFNAHDWVAAIKASGAGYITITSRHHDGFSMFDSKYSDYNIVDATPFKRDILAELRDECKKQGIRFHIYYSLLDWGREDYYPLGRTGLGTGRTSHGEWKTYDEFMNNQLSELVTTYKADAIWLDGWWDHDIHPDFDWHFDKMYANIHKLNPACLIGNNHHITPFEGEDFQMFERDVPGANTAGLSGQDISHLPLETCQTMNGMWGYKIADQDYKSASEIIRLLVKTAGRNANLLLNIGPQPDGELPATSIERLQEVGKWMNVYENTVKNGVRGGCIPPQEWGVTTQKGNKLYIHILDCGGKMLSIPLYDKKVQSAVVYNSRKKVPFTQTKNGVTLTFDEVPSVANPTDYVVELTIK